MLTLRGAAGRLLSVRFVGAGVAAGGPGGCRAWPNLAAGGPPVRLSESHTDCVAATAGGRVLVASAALALFDPVGGPGVVLSPVRPGDGIEHPIVSPDGEHFVALECESPSAGWTFVRRPLSAPGVPDWVVPVAASPFAYPSPDWFLARRYEDNSRTAFLCVHDARTGALLAEHRHAHAYVSHATAATGGGWVLEPRHAEFLAYRADDLSAAPAVVRKPGRTGFTDLAVHPSGRYVLATTADASVRVYDTRTWEISQTYNWKLGRLHGVAFSPDGTLAAAGGDKGRVVVWDFDA